MWEGTLWILDNCFVIKKFSVLGKKNHKYTGLFEMIVGVLTTGHTQYT
jgi:hypothetical protein